MSEPSSSPRPTIALLPWGDWFHDCLDDLGVTVDALIHEFTGSWIFGYVAALDAAGVRTVLIAPTSAVAEPRRAVHRPTGATLWLLPVSRAFRALRGWGYYKPTRRRRDIRLQLHAAVADVTPYLGTPLRRLERVLREERCLAVLCQEYETPRFDLALRVTRRLGIPLVASFQSGDVQYSSLERHLRPRTIRRADRLVIASEEEIDRVRRTYGVSSERIAPIPNPIDTAFWRPARTPPLTGPVKEGGPPQRVVWHGRFNATTKGLDTLIDAWGHLTRGTPGTTAELVLAGAGRDVPLVRRLVAEQRLPRVRLLEGWHDRETIRALLTSATVYAFPSRREGFPLSPIEAMACGCAVVGSDAKGVPEVIGDAGVIVRRDAAMELAAAVRSLLDDDRRRGELSVAAARRARERFSLEAVGPRLRDVLLGSQPVGT